MASRTLLIVASCLFGSGLCALVYQTVWLRAFRLIFGASTPSTAAVLAIFMGGLGLGGLLLGRRVERSAKPLVVYGNLELGIAITAALTPFLLDGARAVYVGLGGSEGLGGVGSTVIRLFLSTLVLGVPVLLMGGTLPAAARAVTHAADIGRKGLAILYGINTLGAVTGAVLSTFALLEIYGARRTLWLACLVNAMIALIARGLGRSLEPVIAPAPPERAERRRLRFSTGWVLVAAFITGFVFLLVELVWYRMAAPLLGGSTYSFGLVLACALLGVGAGGMFYAVSGPREPTPARFAVTCALEALLLLVPFAWGDEIAYLTFHLREWGSVSFPLLVTSWAVITALLVLPAALVAGYQFPMLLALKGKAAREVGKDSGEIYAANTLGSIVGSLGGGFGLLPMLTAPGAWKLAGLLLLGLSAGVALIGRADRPRQAVVACLGALTVMCLLSEGPTAVWRHSAIGAGRGQLNAETWNERRYVENELRRAVAEEVEGLESSLAITTTHGMSPLVNGKSDGNSFADAPTGIGLGIIPAALHGSPKTAFVLGLGTGQTAGWLGTLPSMTRVDVAEIEPAMAQFANLCESTNQQAMKNPKVKVHIADGRELLLVTPEKYDLIVSEPSNPYRAGVASMYSREFYRGVADRLTEGGLFGQWVQSYEIEPGAMQLVIATLQSELPHVSAWQLGPGDLLLIASKHEQVIELERLRGLVDVDPYRTVFTRLFGVYGVEGVLALHLASTDFLKQMAAAHRTELNSDDLPILEFLFARSIGRHQGADLRLDLFATARAHKLERPHVRGEPDWAKVDEQRGRPFVWRNVLPPGVLTESLPPALRAWGSGRAREAIASFAAMGRPLDAFESIVSCAARAEVKDTPENRAILDADLAAARAAGYHADAAWIRVRAAISDGRLDDLPVLVAAATEASRVDPWPSDRIVMPTLTLMQDVPAPAVVVDSLNRPFSAFNFNGLRMSTAARLEFRISTPHPREQCVETVHPFEPFPIWRADFLALRRRCYERHRPELVDAAGEDLQVYLARATGSFALD